MKALNSEITTIIEMIKDPMAVPMAHFTLSETKRDDFDCFSLIKTLLYRLGTNYVASTPHGLNVALFTRAVDLITQIADIDIHNVGLNLGVISPDLAEQFLTRHDDIDVFHQNQKQFIFTLGKVDDLIATTNDAIFLFNRQVLIRNRCLMALGIAAFNADSTQQCPYAGQQLFDGKWLDDIVIGTMIQARNPINN